MKHKADPQTRLEANLKHSNKNKLLHDHVELQFQNIQYALDNITEETFQQIVGKIASARHVLCTSVRSGRPVGEYLSLESIGYWGIANTLMQIKVTGWMIWFISTRVISL